MGKQFLQQDQNTSDHFDLKKHVAAIHSANKLSLVQRKIANALLFNAYKELATKEEHEIHIATLCDLIGYNSHEQRAIKNALISLISTVVEWNLVDKSRIDSEGVWNASAIIADASLDGAICTYSYSPKMRQLLHRPEMYGRLNMQVQARFKSSYGIALYENCIRYQNIHETPWFDMPMFRKLMGVDENKYPAFKDFRKRVIDIAVKEVNQHSYMTIDYLLKKAGRKVVAIKFSIHNSNAKTGIKNNATELNTNKESQSTESTCSINLESSVNIALKNEFGFSQAQIDQAVGQYEESYIIEKINLVRDSKSYQEGKIHNLAKYLQSALLDDYQAPKTSRRQKIIENNINQIQEKQRLKIDIQRQEKILNQFKRLNKNAQTELLKNFKQVIKSTIYETLYRKDELNNEIVARKFTQFLKKQSAWKQDNAKTENV